ncbi:MAG: hypothetical protein ACP5T3_03660, partial [Candidatus Micrarchaeia archaeon]
MRAQSAIEFLTTYGWAFIMIAIFIGVVVILVSSKALSGFAPSSCYISPSLPCYGFSILSNSSGSVAALLFVNNLGTAMSFSNNGIYAHVAKYNSTGTCLPANASSGAFVVCISRMPHIVLPIGSQEYAPFTLSYKICRNGVCSATVYNTSGSAVVSVENYKRLIDSITIKTSPTNGSIAVYGIHYSNNAILPVISGIQYSLFAIPPNKYYSLEQWIVTTNISIDSTVSQSASFIASGNGTIEALFTSSTTST